MRHECSRCTPIILAGNEFAILVTFGISDNDVRGLLRVGNTLAMRGWFFPNRSIVAALMAAH